MPDRPAPPTVRAPAAPLRAPSARNPSAQDPGVPWAGVAVTAATAAALAWAAWNRERVARLDEAARLVLFALLASVLIWGVATLAAYAVSRVRRDAVGRPTPQDRGPWLGAGLLLLGYRLSRRIPWDGDVGYVPAIVTLVGAAVSLGVARRLFQRRFRDLAGAPRRYRLRATRAGVVAAGIALVLLLGAFLGPSNMLLLVFSLVVGPVVVGGAFAASTVARVRVSRHLPEVAVAGEPVPVTLRVQNRGRLFSAWGLDVTDAVANRRESLTARLRVDRVPRRSSHRAVYRLRPHTRGPHLFGPVTVSVRFPLGLIERSVTIDEPGEMLVLPAVGRLTPAWRLRTPATELVRRQTPSRGIFEDEFYQLREYRPGDNPRSIHWRSSARRGDLMVREHHESRDRDLCLLVDLWADRRTPGGTRPGHAAGNAADVERAVSFAATVCVDHLRRNRSGRISLTVAGANTESLAAGNGSGDPEPLLRLLAPAEASADPDRGPLWSRAGRAGPQTRTVLVTTRPPARAGVPDAVGGPSLEVVSVAGDGLEGLYLP